MAIFFNNETESEFDHRWFSLSVLYLLQLIVIERKQGKYYMRMRNVEIEQEKYGKKIGKISIENKRNIDCDGKKIGEI